MNITKISALNFGANVTGNAVKGFDKISHDYKAYSELIPTDLMKEKADTKYLDEFVRVKQLELSNEQAKKNSVNYIDESTIL